MHALCYFIFLFPFGKYFSFSGGPKAHMVLGLFVIFICVFLALSAYLCDAILALVKNKRVFDIVKLILVCIAFPVSLFVNGYGDSVDIASNTYLIGVSVFEICSLFVKDKGAVRA